LKKLEPWSQRPCKSYSVSGRRWEC